MVKKHLQNAFGLGLSYRWLAFDATFNPKWNKKRNEKLGETNEFNLKATLYLRRDIIELFYRRYKGLHISNPEDYLNPFYIKLSGTPLTEAGVPLVELVAMEKQERDELESIFNW